MPNPSNYDKRPLIPAGRREQCLVGWEAIGLELATACSNGETVCIDCYPGAFVDEIERAIADVIKPALTIRMKDLLKQPGEIEAVLKAPLGNDPVFGRMNGLSLVDYFEASRLEEARRLLAQHSGGRSLIVGTGAALIAPKSVVLVHADMARWEIQQRWRRNEIGNLGRENRTASASEKYKCGYFVEWRAADRLKKELLPRIDFLLDTNVPRTPKMIRGDDFRHTLQQLTQRPFRVVPYFDPGPWGGHWMEEVCDLPRNSPNYAWGFDCVPEENSLLLEYGDVNVEIPATDLVFAHPRELLGDAVYARFGAEFPIRFDFLDTMGGGNLSLQVHPLSEYIQEQFGMRYTQDESYYILDAADDATVFLGLKEGVEPAEVIQKLQSAHQGDLEFPADKYIARWPTKKHDHFLIPAGTVHCSGRNCMVLEISATPYIFTFKLWDWGRMGLDGKPRPIHIDHGVKSIQWNRTTEWVRSNLINHVVKLSEGEGRREEATGLHEREFIETRRHWFRGTVPHDSNGCVNVLNLVEGDEAVVESPDGMFQPFPVHYAETFIVPAKVGRYTIRPCGKAVGKECATIKAFLRGTF